MDGTTDLGDSRMSMREGQDQASGCLCSAGAAALHRRLEAVASNEHPLDGVFAIVDVSHVSFQLGHVTLESSRRTSPKNCIGLTRRCTGAGKSLPTPSAVFFVASAIRFFL